MIYVDKKGHLISNTAIDELHEFARKIRLKRAWFQDKQIPHYDLTTKRKILKAIEAGANLVTPSELVTKFRKGLFYD